MTEQEIENGNILIAEFMGLVKKEYKGNTFYNEPPCKINDEYGYSLDQLQYHSSWDWLMPIVEKINDSHKYISIYNEEYWAILNCSIIQKIEYVYEIVVLFIKYYNTNK